MSYFHFPVHLLPEVLPKIRDIDPNRIAVLADYDLTLAAKDRVCFDKAHLTRHQHQGLCALASMISRFAVVTARGEKTSLHYLSEFGAMPNTMLASNSGHLVRLDVDNLGEPWVIHIPGYTGSTIRQAVGAIHGIVGDMKRSHPKILAKQRELCGAVVFQFNGGKESDEHRRFHEQAEACVRALPEEIARCLYFAKKSVETDMPGGGVQTQGYIDIKPKGMDKGLVVKRLFEEGHLGDPEKLFVVVAGDSAPDYDMMKALAPLVPEERRLFISVGPGLKAVDQKNERPLLDMATTGTPESCVQGFHDVLALVAQTPFRSEISLSSFFEGLRFAA